MKTTTDSADVSVRAWTDCEAFAVVNDVPVRVRRTATSIVWKCGQHGRSHTPNMCSHALALAHTPATPDLHRDARHNAPNTQE